MPFPFLAGGKLDDHQPKPSRPGRRKGWEARRRAKAASGRRGAAEAGFCATPQPGWRWAAGAGATGCGVHVGVSSPAPAATADLSVLVQKIQGVGPPATWGLRWCGVPWPVWRSQDAGAGELADPQRELGARSAEQPEDAERLRGGAQGTTNGAGHAFGVEGRL